MKSYREQVDFWYQKIQATSIEEVESQLDDTDKKNQAAGNAAIRKWNKEQDDKRFLEQKKDASDILKAQREGNRIQKWILIILIVTLLASIVVAVSDK